MKFGVGQSVRRKEDDPLLRGRGRYVADHQPVGTLHAVMLRSPHAHARFRLDAGRARAMPGVRLVLTGADVAALGSLPMQAGIPDVDIWSPPHPVLAQSEVRHVGDAVAFVEADGGAGAGCRRGGRGAMGAAAARHWAIAACEATRRRSGRSSGQSCLRGDARQSRRHIEGVCGGGVYRVTHIGQPAARRNYLDTRGVIAEYDGAKDRVRSPSAARAATSSAIRLPAMC
jgi:carbon-monoxide dehydrogenase large subunit